MSDPDSKSVLVAHGQALSSRYPKGMGTEVLAERDLDLLRIRLIMYFQALNWPSVVF